MSNPQETSSPLKIKITEDKISSMKSGDKKRLGAVKLILAAILDKEVEARKPLTDENIFEILKKLSKKSKESLTHYNEANRTELAEQEEFELSVFKEYLPEDMSEEEVQKMIDTRSCPFLFGKFRAAEMERLAGFAIEYSKKSRSRYLCG